MITIFTDGSSLQNPGPGGYCALIKTDGKEKIIKGGEAYTTNNRMELKAVIEALKQVRKIKPREKIKIASDSRLLVSTMTKSWKKKENLDLWMELEKLKKGLKIEWHWIKGHDKHKENELCDKIARQEAEKIKKKTGRTKLLSRENLFFCSHCEKPVSGKLIKLAGSDLIRADCEHCGKFIKFAKHSKDILRRVKEIQQTLF